MFETATLTYGRDSKRVWGTFAGVTGQALLVTCAVIAPMISPAGLPRAAWITTLTAPGPPPPPPLPPGPQIRPRPTTAVATQVVNNTVSVPVWIPPKAIIFDDPPEVASTGGVQGGIAGGDKNGVSGGILTGIIESGRSVAAVVRPPDPVVVTPPKPPVVAVVKPPRVSALELAHPISRVDPVYPPLARQMHISGTVELQGVLGTDGRIHELKVLHGHPLLIKAAVDAVLQWTYAPTILNGQAVEVMAPIIVTFRLTGQ